MKREDLAMFSTRLSARCREQIDRLAKANGCGQAVVIETGIAMLADPDLTAVLGSKTETAWLGLRCWAYLIEQASADNDHAFERQEWNLLADVMNGTMLVLGHERVMSPKTHLWANVADSRADGIAAKWWPNLPPKKAAEKVESLLTKLAGLDFLHAWAVMLAIEWFWQHQDIDHSKDEWWTCTFRRQHVADEPKVVDE